MRGREAGQCGAVLTGDQREGESRAPRSAGKSDRMETKLSSGLADREVVRHPPV
jgi:hypothetical protein